MYFIINELLSSNLFIGYFGAFLQFAFTFAFLIFAIKLIRFILGFIPFW